jgi:hypothetical protein
MSPTSGVAASAELNIKLTDAAPLESAGAAMRACALSKGFEAERATRLQVVVEELIRECRMREAVSSTPGDVSVLAVFTPTGPLPAATLSVPGYAADLLATLAGRLGIHREIRSESVEPTRARSRIHSSASAVAGGLEIRVQEIGRDIAEQVADVLDEYLAMAPATVHLHLPATDPAVAWATADLERVGFAWCAWMPAFLPAGDSIRLQRVNDHPVGLETIVCARAEGEQVRDFVIAEWTRVRRGRTTI